MADLSAMLFGNMQDSAQPIESAQNVNKNEQFLSYLPKGTANLLKSITEGNTPISPTILNRKAGQSLMEGLTTYDPSFNVQDYNLRYNTKKSYTSGREFQNLLALNQAIHHLAQFSQATDVLNNVGFNETSNQIANYVLPAIGHTSTSAHMNAWKGKRLAVSEELMKAFRGTGTASEKEAASWKETFPENAPINVQKEAINAALQLLGGRINTMDESYKNAMGDKAGNFNPLTQTASNIFKVLQKNNGSLPKGYKVPEYINSDPFKDKKTNKVNVSKEQPPANVLPIPANASPTPTPVASSSWVWNPKTQSIEPAQGL